MAVPEQTVVPVAPEVLAVRVVPVSMALMVEMVELWGPVVPVVLLALQGLSVRVQTGASAALVDPVVLVLPAAMAPMAVTVLPEPMPEVQLPTVFWQVPRI